MRLRPCIIAFLQILLMGEQIIFNSFDPFCRGRFPVPEGISDNSSSDSSKDDKFLWFSKYYCHIYCRVHKLRLGCWIKIIKIFDLHLSDITDSECWFIKLQIHDSGVVPRCREKYGRHLNNHQLTKLYQNITLYTIPELWHDHLNLNTIDISCWWYQLNFEPLWGQAKSH